MNKSKLAIEAEKYIRYATRQEVKQREIKTDEQGRICVDKHKTTTINHAAIANDFIKLAGIVPMSAVSRRIIQMKLINPGISMLGVSLQTGLRDFEIKQYEKDGLNRISDFIRRTSIEEAKEKANSNSAVEVAVKNMNVQGENNSLLQPRTP